MRLAVEGEHVVFAQRVDLDVAHEHHLPVLLAEHSRQENVARILGVALGHESHCLGYPFGGFEQPLARGVFAQQPQNGGVVLTQFGDRCRVVYLLFFVQFLFHSGAKIRLSRAQCKFICNCRVGVSSASAKVRLSEGNVKFI